MHVTPRTCPGPGDLWQMSWQEEKREEELALRNNKTPILPQTPFSALFTDFFIDRNPKK